MDLKHALKLCFDYLLKAKFPNHDTEKLDYETPSKLPVHLVYYDREYR